MQRERNHPARTHASAATRPPRRWRAASLASAAAAILAATACDGGYVSGPTDQNVGPGKTIARVVIERGPSVLQVGDSARYHAVVYDNQNKPYEETVEVSWRSLDAGVLAIDPVTGAALARATGDIAIVARVGVVSSPYYRVIVR